MYWILGQFSHHSLNQALRIGVEEAREYVEETWQTLERRLWLPEHGLYAEEADENWVVDPYRSESGNLHMTEGGSEPESTFCFTSKFYQNWHKKFIFHRH